MSSSDAYPVPSVDRSGLYPAEYKGGPAAKQPEKGASAAGSGSGGGPSPGFEVHSDGVRAQAAALAECADRAAAVLDRLRAALEAEGMCWGSDDLGKKFGHSYTGPANQGFASIGDVPKSLTQVANELVRQANAYDALEGHTVEQVQGISADRDAGLSAGA